MTSHSYSPPLDQLLAIEDVPSLRKAWPNYLETYGLGPEHIPALIEMMTDQSLNQGESKSLAVWAPLHAWRALGQLKAEEAVQPILTLWDAMPDDDWAMMELPVVLTMIGPVTIPALSAFLAEPEHESSALTSAAESLQRLGQTYPEFRLACIEPIQQRLAIEPDAMTNGLLVASLVDLEATEAADTIEQAFAEDRVDEMVMGDWQDVQVALGLLDESAIAERPRRPRLDRTLQELLGLGDRDLLQPEGFGFEPIPNKKSDSDKKKKAKSQKEARRKNRKR